MTTYQEALMRAAIARREQILTSAPIIAVPTKRTVKMARKSYKANARASQPTCMMNMGQLVKHQPVPRVSDERTKLLMAAHEKRKETWVRG